MNWRDRMLEHFKLQAWAAALGLAILYLIGAFPIAEIVVTYAGY